MDLYGFFTLDHVKAYPMPAVLSTLLNLAMAAVGYVSYLLALETNWRG